MTESKNEILKISRRDRKHNKKEIQVAENIYIKKSQIAMSCLEQYGTDIKSMS